MRELSLNILDISQNSLAAGAKSVEIAIEADTAKDLLTITITDDGKGMEKRLLESVTDPFSTTRKSRKVGMGLPLLKQAAEQAGGRLEIKSKESEGTTVKAQFEISHIDRMPLGSVEDTVAVLLQNPGGAEISLVFEADGRRFEFNTKEIKKQLEADDITDYETVSYLKDYIRENIRSITGGTIL